MQVSYTMSLVIAQHNLSPFQFSLLAELNKQIRI